MLPNLNLSTRNRLRGWRSWAESQNLQLSSFGLFVSRRALLLLAMARETPVVSPSKLLEAQLLIARSHCCGEQEGAEALAAQEPATKEKKSSASSQRGNEVLGLRVVWLFSFMLELTFCSWSAKKNHHFSDSLLGIIEDNPVYKVALGFYKGDIENVPNGGKKVIEHH